MYQSKVSPYNVADATPWKRDPLRELAEACRRHKMRLGVYYSQAVDWEHPDGAGNSWDFNEKDTDLEQLSKTYPRLFVNTNCCRS